MNLNIRNIIQHKRNLEISISLKEKLNMTNS